MVLLRGRRGKEGGGGGGGMQNLQVAKYSLCTKIANFKCYSYIVYCNIL